MPAAIDLDDRAVAPHADRGPHADLRIGAEQVVGYVQRDGQDVAVGERILSGPLEAMERAVGIGEERIAAHAEEQADRSGLTRVGRGVEAGGGIGDENLADRLRIAGRRAGREVRAAGLPAVLALGKYERE